MLRGLLWLLCATLVSPLAVALSPAPTEGENQSITVFLVRHAEKLKDSDDPGLSARGVARADALAKVLSDVEITHVWTTDYRRTRETAIPVAQSKGLEPESYNPRDLPAFAETLRQQPGVHLVVGHSNTTPALVELLGGEPGQPIEEEHEYDRLYWVFLTPTGELTSVLLRYDNQ